jgi:hypothetical protein
VPQIKNSKHHFDPSVRSAIIRYNKSHKYLLNKRRRQIRSTKANLFDKQRLFLDSEHVAKLNTLIYKSM